MHSPALVDLRGAHRSSVNSRKAAPALARGPLSDPRVFNHLRKGILQSPNSRYPATMFQTTERQLESVHSTEVGYINRDRLYTVQ